jgi:hypothetical protein
MSPIGNVLLMNCENDMSIHLKTAQNLLPNVPERRIKTVAKMLGVTIKE